MPGPFMYVTDRRHSKYVLTIYCIVTRVTHLDHLCVVPTDATASMYLLLTVFFYPGDIPGLFICVTDRRHSKYVFIVYCIVYPGGMPGPFLCVTDIARELRCYEQ